MASRRWGNGARVDDVDIGKKKLLKAAITCFVSKGIHSTTIEDIANAANVTRRTVYRYYGGKTELIAAVIDLERRRLFEALGDAAEAHKHDFPAMLTACIARGAEILSPIAGSSNLVSGEQGEDSLSDLLGIEAIEEWEALFGAAYRDYRATHANAGDLHDIIEITARLIHSFHHMPSDAESISKAVEAFMSIRSVPSSIHFQTAISQ